MEKSDILSGLSPLEKEVYLLLNAKPIESKGATDQDLALVFSHVAKDEFQSAIDRLCNLVTFFIPNLFSSCL
jgi:hypothetical protein